MLPILGKTSSGMSAAAIGKSRAAGQGRVRTLGTFPLRWKKKEQRLSGGVLMAYAVGSVRLVVG
jgi:hypothetical protein